MALGQGQIIPWGQTECKFKNNLIELWYYMIISWLLPGQGQKNPCGTEIWCLMEHFATMANWCKLKTVWTVILYIFFISYMFIAQGQSN